jgi:DNA-binding transcriptional ArsR family regulator
MGSSDDPMPARPEPGPDTRPDRRPDRELQPDDGVFRALADPHRRLLMDTLYRRDGQSLSELCEVLPSMTRFGVMKHLAVLADAGLVVSERHGRHKHHYLNPVPIRRIHDRWIAKYALATVAEMIDLAQKLEEES